MRQGIRAVLGTIQRICYDFFWRQHFLAHVQDFVKEKHPLQDKRQLAYDAIQGAILEATLINLRAFDAFCSGNERDLKPGEDDSDRDLVPLNFEGLKVGGSFLNRHDRKKINKLIPHLTHKYLAEPVVEFEYQRFLSVAIPKAKVFCRYADSTIGSTDSALLERVRRVCGLLESVEKFYGKQPHSSAAHA